MKRRMAVFATLVVVLAAGSLLFAQGNPFVGTWKLDLANSKYNPGPAPKSQTRTWDASGMVMVNSIGATGTASAGSDMAVPRVKAPRGAVILS